MINVFLALDRPYRLLLVIDNRLANRTSGLVNYADCVQTDSRPDTRVMDFGANSIHVEEHCLRKAVESFARFT